MEEPDINAVLARKYLVSLKTSQNNGRDKYQCSISSEVSGESLDEPNTMEEPNINAVLAREYLVSL